MARRKRSRPRRPSESRTNQTQPPSAGVSALGRAFSSTGVARSALLAEAEAELRVKMEQAAERLRDLVLSQPPRDLLAYLWSLMLTTALADSEAHDEATEDTAQQNVLLAVLEYLHAIWSCYARDVAAERPLSEPVAAEIVQLVEELRQTAMFHSMAASAASESEAFGEATRDVEFQARSAWVLIRGNRYQVLEGEFLEFVLSAHDEALISAYGVGARAIATGIQSIATSMREGLAVAASALEAHLNVHEAATTDTSPDPAAGAGGQADPSASFPPAKPSESIHRILDDLLKGGICNLSKHTALPAALLKDLAFERGENHEFFAPGPFRGTPLRTLPGRVRPLVVLDGEFYATDANFVRDSAYRAIGRGLRQALPAYFEEWNRRQKTVTESAFHTILSRQLEGAEICTGIHYRDVTTGAWVETDAVIELDDVLIVVEAKAGTAAMSSPATNFDGHARAVKKLIVEAHQQCRRFIEYLASATEVELCDGAHKTMRRIRLSQFRRVLPIGLTIEAFTPFSAMSKEIPSVAPILGKHSFISMSLDDLFVLSRFLPAAGALTHYLSVRQRVAELTNAVLFDEIDHLGAYIERNRFDLALRAELRDKDRVTWDGFSEVVDRHFRGDTWTTELPPQQKCPERMQELLEGLNRSRRPGWLGADHILRDLSFQRRLDLDDALNRIAPTVAASGRRWFALSGQEVSPLLFWLSAAGEPLDESEVVRQAEVVAIASQQPVVCAICAFYDRESQLTAVSSLMVSAPPADRRDYRELIHRAHALQERTVPMPGADPQTARVPTRLGRNEICWCGSGLKFKRCHGR